MPVLEAKVTLTPATIARLRSSLEQYHAAQARGVVTSLELKVQKSRVCALWIENGYEILKILEAKEVPAYGLK